MLAGCLREDIFSGAFHESFMQRVTRMVKERNIFDEVVDRRVLITVI